MPRQGGKQQASQPQRTNCTLVVSIGCDSGASIRGLLTATQHALGQPVLTTLIASTSSPPPMSQPAHRDLLEDLPDDEPWPPVPPNLNFSAIQVEKPELAVSMNSMLYRIKNDPSKVFKMRAEYREYQLQDAAGDCALPVRGKVLGKPKIGDVSFYGFLMDLATPVISANILPSQRRDIMHQMIGVVQRLHARGIVHGDIKLENMLLDDQGTLRLCDFAEGRYVDEDEDVWEGRSTMHFDSPNRLVRGQQAGRSLPPPVMEDDLYGLGLSIWQLYTGGIPHDEVVGDDLELREIQQKGETVDVEEVDDLEARGIIMGLLRGGGARI